MEFPRSKSVTMCYTSVTVLLAAIHNFGVFLATATRDEMRIVGQINTVFCYVG
jgi:hypothetical protein